MKTISGLRLNLKSKMRVRKLERSFIRDRWGNLTDCYWNEMIKEEITKNETKRNNT
jgi:hypothetical protein